MGDFMNNVEIKIEHLSKIEGHTNMFVRVKNGKVIKCELAISENQRFFKKAIEGMQYSLVPTTVSRICGTCSGAHLMAATEAIEKAYRVNTSEQTFKLRRLLMNGSHLRDHAMHLYFFCLPDLFKKDSIFDFNDSEKQWIEDGLAVKDAGTFLSAIIGGRAVHPTTCVVGGFNKYPTKEEMKQSIEKLNGVRPKILKIIKLFHDDKRTFTRKANYLGIVNDDYNYMKGKIKTAFGSVIEEENYRKHLEEVVLPYSNATAFTFESKDFMVGSLARINLNKDNLHAHTKEDCKVFLKIFPNNCIFNNNTAQAVECLHAVDLSIDIMEELIKHLDYDEKSASVVARDGVGMGVVEAPRGTLYYKLDCGKDGKIKEAELIIPTQQNVKHLEKDVAQYVTELLAQNKSKEDITLLVEEMIRAYDPCMSCATHFLKIDWNEDKI